MKFFKYCFSLIAVCTILSSCSTTTGQQQQILSEQPKTLSTNKNWWYARFLINWPEDKSPNWHIDVLLADKVIRPVLLQNRAQIKLWRFHRRAGRKWGHIFSFIFYAEPKVAKRIYQDIGENTVLFELLDDGVVERYTTEDLTNLKRPNIEDTSDKHWNKIIQKSWPYYIMGVSEMWLDMIDLLVTFNNEKQEPLQEHYLHIHEAITKLWENEGGHAFLHHLNALFAYQPVAITERRLMNY